MSGNDCFKSLPPTLDDILEYRQSLQRFSSEPVIYQELSVGKRLGRLNEIN